MANKKAKPDLDKNHQIDVIGKIADDCKFDCKSVICRTLNGEEKLVEVKTHISLTSLVHLVKDVVDNLFISIDGEMTYAPYYYNVAVAHALLLHFTNLNVNVNLEQLAVFAQSQSYMDIVDCIDELQYEQLLDSIDEGIEYRKQEILFNQKDLLEKNLDKLQTITSVFERLEESFKSIDITEMMEIAKSLSQKDMKEIAQTMMKLKRNEKISEADEPEGQIKSKNLTLVEGVE